MRPWRPFPAALWVSAAALATVSAAPARALAQVPAPWTDVSAQTSAETSTGTPAATPGTRLEATMAPGPGGASEWVNAVLLFGTLLALDAEAREGVQSWRGELGNDLSSVAKRPGEWELMLPIVAGGSLLGGWLAAGEGGMARGVAVIAGTLAGSGASEAVNQALGRGRPSWGEGPLDFRPFRGHASFPSGHAAFAFSVAGSLDAVTESPAVAAVAYGVAGLTALSRVYDDQHWVSDVVAGSVLSAVVARRAAAAVAGALGARREGEQPAENSDEPGPELRLSVTPTGLAARLAF